NCYLPWQTKVVSRGGPREHSRRDSPSMACNVENPDAQGRTVIWSLKGDVRSFHGTSNAVLARSETMVVDLRELARQMLADYDARTPGQFFGEPLDLTAVQAYALQAWPIECSR